MRMKTTLTLFVSVLAALPLAAASPNLLGGGGFDTPAHVALWGLPQGTRTSEANEAAASWIGVDALGSPNSGAMIMTGNGAVAQCVAVEAGKSYDFGARILVAT